MHVLDTNVLSELTKSHPKQRVFDWVAEHPSNTQFTTTMSQAKIFAGIVVARQASFGSRSSCACNFFRRL